MESLKEEERRVERREEEGWDERGVKVEVEAWKRVPAVRGNCHVLLG